MGRRREENGLRWSKISSDAWKWEKWGEDSGEENRSLRRSFGQNWRIRCHCYRLHLRTTIREREYEGRWFLPRGFFGSGQSRDMWPGFWLNQSKREMSTVDNVQLTNCNNLNQFDTDMFSQLSLSPSVTYCFHQLEVHLDLPRTETILIR